MTLLPTMMEAVVMRAFGGPEVLRLEDVPAPRPRAGEVLVRVHAVSVNRTLDLEVRAGRYARTPALPHVLGVDPSGVVIAVGEGVSDRKVGDRVFCRPSVGQDSNGASLLLGVNVWGGYAEYVTVPARTTTLIPDGVDFATATVVARHAPLAFTQLRDKAKVQSGEWVLVMGAAGGLGSAAVQAAKYLGAKVIAAAGSDDRVAAAMALGADAGINYRASDLAAEARRITGGRGVDVVLENIGDADLFPGALAALGRNGRLVTAGGHGGGVVPLDVKHLYLNLITIIGAPTENPAASAEALEAAAAGAFKVSIDAVLPLSAAAEAHARVERREPIGKILLDPTLPA